MIRLACKRKDAIADSVRVDASEFCLFTTAQRKAPGFPFSNVYDDACPYTRVWSLDGSESSWVPQPFVTLQDEYQTGIPTSSGLAAGPTATQALLRAVQELIERDALMVTWLHGLPGRRVNTSERHKSEVTALDGEVYTFDLTPKYSPFPVVAVAGGIRKNGTWRYSLGVACRETWADAAEKAYLEWNQGVLFAGIYNQYVDTGALTDGHKLKSFDEHAMYYTVNPSQWKKLRLFTEIDVLYRRPSFPRYESDKAALTDVTTRLRQHGLRVYYRDITTIDAEQVGVRVVKALSPDMAMIFAHQEWPFIGKVEGLLASRYPKSINGAEFPYLMPHPLG